MVLPREGNTEIDIPSHVDIRVAFGRVACKALDDLAGTLDTKDGRALGAVHPDSIGACHVLDLKGLQ
jgi:hypothetical protein